MQLQLHLAAGWQRHLCESARQLLLPSEAVLIAVRTARGRALGHPRHLTRRMQTTCLQSG